MSPVPRNSALTDFDRLKVILTLSLNLEGTKTQTPQTVFRYHFFKCPDLSAATTKTQPLGAYILSAHLSHCVLLNVAVEGLFTMVPIDRVPWLIGQGDLLWSN